MVRQGLELFLFHRGRWEPGAYLDMLDIYAAQQNQVAGLFITALSKTVGLLPLTRQF
jgi:hypothetical protein